MGLFMCLSFCSVVVVAVFVYLNRCKRWQKLSLQLLNRREFYAKLHGAVAAVCKRQHDLKRIATSFRGFTQNRQMIRQNSPLRPQKVTAACSD